MSGAVPFAVHNRDHSITIAGVRFKNAPADDDRMPLACDNAAAIVNWRLGDLLAEARAQAIRDCAEVAIKAADEWHSVGVVMSERDCRSVASAILALIPAKEMADAALKPLTETK